MKCVKKAGEVKRVKNEQAFEMVKDGWSFCKKTEWKNGGRVAPKVEEVIETEEKSIKAKKIDKRNRKAVKSAARKEKAEAEKTKEVEKAEKQKD